MLTQLPDGTWITLSKISNIRILDRIKSLGQTQDCIILDLNCGDKLTSHSFEIGNAKEYASELAKKVNEEKNSYSWQSWLMFAFGLYGMYSFILTLIN